MLVIMKNLNLITPIMRDCISATKLNKAVDNNDIIDYRLLHKNKINSTYLIVHSEVMYLF